MYTLDKFFIKNKKNILCKKGRFFEADSAPSPWLQILLHKLATSVSLVPLRVLFLCDI